MRNVLTAEYVDMKRPYMSLGTRGNLVKEKAIGEALFRLSSSISSKEDGSSIETAELVVRRGIWLN